MQANVVTAAATAPVVAPNAVGDMRIERDGNQRWLVTPIAPEQLWSQLRLFWTESGFSLAVDEVQTGVMETDWAENRGKIPMDGVRRLFGGMMDPFYSTGERDRFRTRVERTATGSEIYITHRGIEEYLSTDTRDLPVWRNRPNDPQLEAAMLVRLMAKLGSKPDAARTQVAARLGARGTGTCGQRRAGGHIGVR